MQRRTLITASGALALGASPLQALAQTVTLPFDNGERPIAKYPQKRPLIRLTTRPPQLETPFAVFNEGILTPNDAFFVRYHLSDIPTKIDPAMAHPGRRSEGRQTAAACRDCKGTRRSIVGDVGLRLAFEFLFDQDQLRQDGIKDSLCFQLCLIDDGGLLCCGHLSYRLFSSALFMLTAH